MRGVLIRDMDKVKLLAAVYLAATGLIYLRMIWEDKGTVTVSFLGSKKNVSKRMLIASNLLDGILMAICAYVIVSM